MLMLGIQCSKNNRKSEGQIKSGGYTHLHDNNTSLFFHIRLGKIG